MGAAGILLHIGERRRGEGMGVGNKFFEAGFSVSRSMFLG
jgi:hypothetical protein